VRVKALFRLSGARDTRPGLPSDHTTSPALTERRA